MSLNPSQKAAVDFAGEHALVLAPAGAGKTRVLTERVARLIERGTKPDRIVCVTFTTKAAREMRERLARRVGADVAGRVYLGTFHAWASVLIRRAAERVGLTEDFSIFDEQDQLDLWRHIGEALGLRLRESDTLKTIAKKAEKAGKLETLRAMYADTLTRYNARDFDSLETTLLDLLEQHADVVADVRRRADHVLVDEFQDTSGLQARILDALAPAHLFAVGDFSQSIYGFRGARAQNVIDFAARADVRTLKLSHNYRSGRAIVAAGNAIARECGSPLADVQAGRDVDGRVEIIDHLSVESLPGGVARDINDAVVWGEPPTEPRNVMVLGRTWREVMDVAKALAPMEIPCVVPRGANDLWGSGPARAIVSALRFALNVRDIHSLRRVCAWPQPAFLSSAFTLLEHECRSGRRDPLAVLREKVGGHLRLDALETMRLRLHGEVVMKPSDIARGYLLESLAEDELAAMSLDTQAASVEDVIDAVALWETTATEPTVEAFVEWYALRRLGEDEDDGAEEPNAVRCMTVHASKGLEASVVHVVGCYDGGLPARWDVTDDDLAEARRLFYVAVTRAADRVVLHSADTRTSAKRGTRPVGRSTFLTMIEGVAS